MSIHQNGDLRETAGGSKRSRSMSPRDPTAPGRSSARTTSHNLTPYSNSNTLPASRRGSKSPRPSPRPTAGVPDANEWDDPPPYQSRRGSKESTSEVRKSSKEVQRPSKSPRGPIERKGSKDRPSSKERSSTMQRSSSKERTLSKSPRDEPAPMVRKGSKESTGRERRGSKDATANGIGASRKPLKERVKRKGTPKGWTDARFQDKAFLDELFRRFDPEGDGSGSLDVKLMYELLKYVDMDLQYRDVEQLVRQIDLDGNGTVEIDEFHFFFAKARDRSELRSMTSVLIDKKDQAFVKELFKNFDSSGTGNMKETDLFELTEFMNMNLSKEEVHILLNTIDLDGNGTIELDELLFFFDKVASRNELVEMMKTMTVNNRQFLAKVFEMFDPENTGSLNERQLHDVCKFLKLNFSRRAVKSLLAKMDEDGNGTVEIDEFYAFFDTVKDMTSLKDQLDSQRKAHRIGESLQRVLMVVGIVLGIIFLVKSGEEKEKSKQNQYSTKQDTSQQSLFIFLGSVFLVIGLLFALLQFGFKWGGVVITKIFCTCNQKRFLMWGIVCLIIELTLVMIHTFSNVGASHGEEDTSFVPYMIIFGVLTGVFVLAFAWAQFGPPMQLFEVPVAPDSSRGGWSARSPKATPRSSRGGSYSVKAVKGPDVEQGSLYDQKKRFNGGA